MEKQKCDSRITPSFRLENARRRADAASRGNGTTTPNRTGDSGVSERGTKTIRIGAPGRVRFAPLPTPAGRPPPDVSLPVPLPVRSLVVPEPFPVLAEADPRPPPRGEPEPDRLTVLGRTAPSERPGSGIAEHLGVSVASGTFVSSVEIVSGHTVSYVDCFCFNLSPRSRRSKGFDKRWTGRSRRSRRDEDGARIVPPAVRRSMFESST